MWKCCSGSASCSLITEVNTVNPFVHFSVMKPVSDFDEKGKGKFKGSNPAADGVTQASGEFGGYQVLTELKDG